MRILVTGGRNYKDIDTVRRALSEYKDMNVIIVHGNARGADTLCSIAAKEMGIATEPHPAEWNKYGKAAGFIRNAEMVKSGIDLVLAFPGGNGTHDCIRKAEAYSIPVIRIGVFDD